MSPHTFIGDKTSSNIGYFIKICFEEYIICLIVNSPIYNNCPCLWFNKIVKVFSNYSDVRASISYFFTSIYFIKSINNNYNFSFRLLKKINLINKTSKMHKILNKFSKLTQLIYDYK